MLGKETQVSKDIPYSPRYLCIPSKTDVWWICEEGRLARKIGEKSSERNTVSSCTNLLHERKTQNNHRALSSNSLSKKKRV